MTNRVHDPVGIKPTTPVLRYRHIDHFMSASQARYNFLSISILILFFFLCSDWMMWASPESILRMLMCLRILMRDSAYQKHFFTQGGVKQLSEYFNKATDSYLYYGDTPCMVDILKEMTSKFDIFPVWTNIAQEELKT